MLQNSYDNYTQKPQLNAKLKVLRKIIAFVFAINMLITRFFGGPAGTQLRQAEVFTDSSASQTYVFTAPICLRFYRRRILTLR